MNEETYGTCTEERSVRAPSSPSRALFWLGCLVAVAVCVRAADGSLRRTERTQSVSETVRSKRMQRCNLNEGEVWLIRHGEKADKLTPGTPEYWGLNASGFARAEYVAGLITSGVWPQFSRVYACHPGRSLRPLETAIPIGIALGQRVDDRFRPREYLAASADIRDVAVAGTRPVLVVWEHCCTPALLAALGCTDDVCQRCWPDGWYDDVIRMCIPRSGGPLRLLPPLTEGFHANVGGYEGFSCRSTPDCHGAFCRYPNGTWLHFP
eukprot:TRINITY_DN11962_c0_g1_i1.p1 TRINITY_DN11962_c0_g1~~TRINITY_DN11962_c0_g1_i1.p1  ORF type:complete len:283 (+),score=15.15 TRINITY_DN11962_c0_g1_i1:52-849(+)